MSGTTPSLIAGVVSAAIAFLGTFLPWATTSSTDFNAWDTIPFAFIWDQHARPGNLGVGLVVTVIAVAGALFSLVAALNILRALAGLAIVAIAIAFALQVNSVGDPLGYGSGIVVSGIGGALLIASAFLPRRKGPGPTQ